MMKVVRMILLLVPTVTIVLSTDNASKLCVLYTNGDSYNTQFRTGNFTFEDILNITSSDIEESAREIYHFEECFHYTSEKFSDI